MVGSSWRNGSRSVVLAMSPASSPVSSFCGARPGLGRRWKNCTWLPLRSELAPRVLNQIIDSEDLLVKGQQGICFQAECQIVLIPRRFFLQAFQLLDQAFTKIRER